ncbi:MAG: ribonuclease III [Oscillospiraceae bacterium]|jgi:ribonuclease-3 family protein|nr:ribonuclease III [Oscillospiraceae bacterium]
MSKQEQNPTPTLAANYFDIRAVSPLEMAFVGDAVYELLVRKHLVQTCGKTVGAHNAQKVALVRCEFQSKAAKALVADFLTEDEITVFKRGRNAATNTVPKNSTVADYHNATGLECLFGYLELTAQFERMTEIFEFVLGKFLK